MEQATQIDRVGDRYLVGKHDCRLVCTGECCWIIFQRDGGRDAVDFQLAIVDDTGFVEQAGATREGDGEGWARDSWWIKDALL